MADKESLFYCKHCDVRCESTQTWSQHLSGKKHSQTVSLGQKKNSEEKKHTDDGPTQPRNRWTEEKKRQHRNDKAETNNSGDVSAPKFVLVNPTAVHNAPKEPEGGGINIAQKIAAARVVNSQQQQQQQGEDERYEKRNAGSSGANHWANQQHFNDRRGGSGKDRKPQQSNQSGDHILPRSKQQYHGGQPQSQSQSAQQQQPLYPLPPAHHDRQIPYLRDASIHSKNVHEKVQEFSAEMEIPKALNQLFHRPTDDQRYIKEGWLALQKGPRVNTDTEGEVTTIRIEGASSLAELREIESFLCAMVEFAPYQTGAPPPPKATPPTQAIAAVAATGGKDFNVTSSTSPNQFNSHQPLLNFGKRAETDSPMVKARTDSTTWDAFSGVETAPSIQNIWN